MNIFNSLFNIAANEMESSKIALLSYFILYIKSK
jgi:hypothetical protein